MKSICFLYGGAPEAAERLNLIPDVLRNSEIVVGSSSRYEVGKLWSRPQQLILDSKSYLYVDWWGASYGSKLGAAHRWMPGPLDWHQEAEITRSPSGAWPYVIDERHVGRFVAAVNVILQTYVRSRRVFVDDFTFGLNYWRLTPEQMDIVWPGWRLPGWADFIRESMAAGEAAMRWLAQTHGGEILVNGYARTSGPRLWESLGEWLSMTDLHRFAQPGDAVLVKGILGDRETWAETDAAREVNGGYEGGTSFRNVFLDLLPFAEVRGLRVALSLSEAPPEGGSTMNVHKFTDPGTWGAI